ncbi:MAG TPA: substrate-binding domain-containing protein, partial [Clostridiaceae bacterium]|nr:substrate-binding domain-containing protein [Clostridiaceae bacterium]
MVLGILTGCGGDKEEAETTEAPPAAEATDAADDTQEATDEAADDAEDAAAPAGDIRIALVMSHQTNAFTTEFSNAAVAAGKDLGVEVTVFDGKKDVAQQITQIQSAISQKYDGILVEPVSVEGIKPAVEMANEAGIPIATCIQKMKDQELAKAYIGGDDTAAGELQMRKACEDLGGKGNIAILYGPMGSDAQIIRLAGYEKALEDYPDVEIVFDTTANWVTDEALKVTENWLASGKELNAIVSQNDSMAIGA